MQEVYYHCSKEVAMRRTRPDRYKCTICGAIRQPQKAKEAAERVERWLAERAAARSK